jgi:hypothetical protein
VIQAGKAKKTRRITVPYFFKNSVVNPWYFDTDPDQCYFGTDPHPDPRFCKIFPKFFWKICFLWSRSGAGVATGTGTVTCQKSEPEP